MIKYSCDTLNSPTSVQLTHEKRGVYVEAWAHDKAHLIISGVKQDKDGATCELYSIPIVGGDPEFIMGYPDCDYATVARDGSALVTILKDKADFEQLAISDPLGSPLKVYEPNPLAGKTSFRNNVAGFSPDGKTILYYRNVDRGWGEAWLLPYPATRGKPRRVLGNVPLASPYNFSWMPDGRHLLFANHSVHGGDPHLWMADTSSSEGLQLTAGTGYELDPVASPDGKTILYAQQIITEEVISVSVEDGSTKTEVSTQPGRENTEASWSSGHPKLAWATNRNGPVELWVRELDGSERAAVRSRLHRWRHLLPLQSVSLPGWRATGL